MDPEKIFKKRNLASLAPVVHVQLFVVDEGEAGEAVGQPLHHLLHLVDQRYPHLSHLVHPVTFILFLFIREQDNYVQRQLVSQQAFKEIRSPKGTKRDCRMRSRLAINYVFG